MKKYIEPPKEHLKTENIDATALGMIAHTQDPKKIAFTLAYYTYGKKEHEFKTEQVWAILKKYDCHVIVTIEKLLYVANKIIEEYGHMLPNRKVNKKPSKNKASRAPANSK